MDADLIALDHDGMILQTHGADACSGQVCCIHNPSGHHMATWPQAWDTRRRTVRRVCEHGIPHPDPDDIAFKMTRFGQGVAVAELLHPSCDGCCRTGTDPGSFEEWQERYLSGLRTEGVGVGTVVVFPCPFCAAPNWWSHSLVDPGEALPLMATTCVSCGRVGRMRRTTVSGELVVELVLVDGPDVPDWYQPRPTREGA